MRVLQFYVSASHKDYHKAREQANESRRLFNTLNKIQYEKQEHRKTGADTPVAQGLDIDILSDNIEKQRKRIHKYIDIRLTQKVSQSIGREFKSRWDTVIKQRMCGIKTGDIHYKDTYSKVIYNTQAISRRKLSTRIIPTGWKDGFQLPEHVQLHQVKAAELKPTPDGFVLIVQYQEDKPEHQSDNLHMGAGDIGIDNLLTIITTGGDRPKNVSGKLLKSKNRYYNKKIAQLAHKHDKCIDEIQKHSYQKQINRLWYSRKKEFRHIMHSISNEIVRYLTSQKVGEFVIGWNTGMKQNTRLGKRNNQHFAYMPLAEFRDILIYKLTDAGIIVSVTEESYTSKSSFIDGDELPMYNKHNNQHHTFSGKRISRGMYKSADGTLIHADVNAAWNILRKCKPSIGWSSEVIVTPERLKVTL